MSTSPSLFRLILGAQIDQLAPALKRHYDVAPGQQVIVSGPMDAWNRVPWLRPFIPFMPVPGKAVPVHVRSVGVMDRGEPCFAWYREFRNPTGTALSYTLTRTPPGSHTVPCVMDTFNQPPNIGVVQRLFISDDGRTLKQVTYGPQYALFGRRTLLLPKPFHIQSIAVERALDDNTIHTDVSIRHWALGPMFGYSGALAVGPITKTDSPTQP
jgi:hypothetical protein